MTECALFIALLLGRPPGLVATVYEMAGLSGVVVCDYESQFNEKAWRREAEGTSWGLWQLYSKCHPQYRDDLLLHLAYGADFWNKCIARSGVCRKDEGDHRLPTTFGANNPPPRFSIARAYSIYNSGSPTRSIEKGRAVQRRYESLAMYLWRRMR
jgi:hypothetical protein